MRKLAYSLVFLVFAFLAITVTMKNMQPVAVQYYFNIQWETSLAFAMFACFASGLIVGALLMTVSVFKNKRQVGKTKKQLAKVEKEVENLRAMPIKDEV